MRVLAAIVLVLLAPDQTHELKYRFEKGVSWEDNSTRTLKLELIAGNKLLTYATETRQVMQRTVLEVDDKGLPVMERIEVKEFTFVIKEWPDQPAGAKNYPSHGKTFVWRRLKDQWGLYAEKGEVTKSYPRLVERLQNWRDARLPTRPVAVGDHWEVSAERFLQTVGQQVPPDVKGRAQFTLKEVRDGVATVDFDFKQEYRDGERLLSGSQKGIWRFDVANSRDLELEMKGTMRVDNGRAGAGYFSMKRKLTYAAGS